MDQANLAMFGALLYNALKSLYFGEKLTKILKIIILLTIMIPEYIEILYLFIIHLLSILIHLVLTIIPKLHC